VGREGCSISCHCFHVCTAGSNLLWTWHAMPLQPHGAVDASQIGALIGAVICMIIAPLFDTMCDSRSFPVMALERIPADIRADGGVARMSDPCMIKEIRGFPPRSISTTPRISISSQHVPPNHTLALKFATAAGGWYNRPDSSF
jgi:hypothetical protein